MVKNLTAMQKTIKIKVLLFYYDIITFIVTWKHFMQYYLARGLVDRLEVVDKQFVPVIPAPGTSLKKYAWFSTGTVDTFKRNLETTQWELGIEPPNQTAMVYTTESDGTFL